jgi:hypothetical protein
LKQDGDAAPTNTAETALDSQYLKSIIGAIMSGDLLEDTGIADTYALDPFTDKQGPSKLINGMRVRGVIQNNNTGASTLNLNGLGAKSIVTNTGTALGPDTLRSGQEYTFQYDLANDRFFIVNISLSPTIGFKNRLINGDFQSWPLGDITGETGTTAFASIWQRAVGGSGTAADIDLTQEMFALGQTDVPGNPRNFLRIRFNDTGSGLDATSEDIIRQAMEDVATFSNGQMNFSFYARSTIGSRELGLFIDQHYGTGGSPSADQETFIDRVTLTSDWALYSVTTAVPDTSAGTRGNDGNDALRIVLGSNYGASTRWGVADPGGALGYVSTGDIEVVFTQAEEGSVATDYDFRPASIEDTMINRYLVVNTVGGQYP